MGHPAIRSLLVAATLLSVGTVAAVFWLLTRGAASQIDRAGVAYIQNEDGSLVELSDTRAAKRTEFTPHSQALAAPDKAAGSDEAWLKQFTLIERSRKEMGSEELKGQPYVAGFFFTSCPTICPKQNAKVQQLQEKFRGQPVRFVSISCDPEIDRPGVLTEYAKRFNADPEQWLFFTGDLDYIRRVGGEYFGLGIMRYAHPEKLVLMDASGKPYGYYTWSDAGQWQALQDDIKKLIHQPSK